MQTKTVDVFWSHQSPYCYFALDRILAVNARGDVEFVVRLVLPGVIRNPEVFRDTPEIAQRYFLQDVQRTADFLGLAYAEARPYPVQFQSGTIYRAAEAQPRLKSLYHLSQAANELNQGWRFLDQVSRTIWDGSTRNWHTGGKLKNAMRLAGLDYATLAERAQKNAENYELIFAENHGALLASGHWGVPAFVYNGEAFYGQDRFDQLLWRMDLPGLDG